MLHPCGIQKKKGSHGDVLFLFSPAFSHFLPGTAVVVLFLLVFLWVSKVCKGGGGLLRSYFEATLWGNWFLGFWFFKF